MKPTYSPWGAIQLITRHGDGLYFVSTASHGGFMAIPGLLSPAAEKHSQLYQGWYCFEEDCKALIVIRERPELRQRNESDQDLDKWIAKFDGQYLKDRKGA